MVSEPLPVEETKDPPPLSAPAEAHVMHSDDNNVSSFLSASDIDQVESSSNSSLNKTIGELKDAVDDILVQRKERQSTAKKRKIDAINENLKSLIKQIRDRNAQEKREHDSRLAA